MKYLKRLNESGKYPNVSYIEDCFLDISENPNFEVDDLIEVSEPQQSIFITTSLLVNNYVFKLHIEKSKTISLPQPINSNLWIGMVDTDLEFLKKVNRELGELYEYIEVAVNRIRDEFPNSEIKIQSNKRDEIDIYIIIKK